MYVYASGGLFYTVSHFGLFLSISSGSSQQETLNSWTSNVSFNSGMLLEFLINGKAQRKKEKDSIKLKTPPWKKIKTPPWPLFKECW